MPKKMLVADLLCGAGGSSTGAARALAELGLEMELVCLNHWPTALDTHQRNHPEARHYCQDISTARPHIIVPEGYLDLLMASPTCTFHSIARGGKPTSDQQRSDPWHIITWLTELRVKRLIIENVWEFCKWGPIDRRSGKPIKSRQGEYFNAWIDTMRRLGFVLEWRKLNAADYGDATTRERFILMGRSDRKRVLWPVATHRKVDKRMDDLFATEKPWRPAREIIDWSIKGRSIFNRPKDLAPKTIARIYAGALKFGWPEPYIVILRQHMGARGLDLPLPVIAASGNHIGLAEPIIGNMKGRSTATSSGEPLPTQTAHAAHLFTAEPLILGTGNNGAARPAGDPLPTITTGGAGSDERQGCARPMLITVAHGTEPGDHNHGRRAHDIDEPLGVIHAGGKNFAVVEPFTVSTRHGKLGGGPRPRSVEQPLPTILAGGSQACIVEPFVLSQASGGAPRAVEQPLPTSTTGGKGAAHALISPYYGEGSGQTCVSIEESPLPTVTVKGRFGMVVPVTHSQGGNAARSTDDPVPTMTTAKGGEFAVVMPVTHHDASDRVRGTDEPLPVITGANRGELAVVSSIKCDAGEDRGNLYDILFRMLEPHELAAAMGFNDGEIEYEFAGTKTDKIKQIGNAVSVAKMKACVGSIMADAAPKKRTPVEFKRAAE